MNILDENISKPQRELLESWGIAVRQIGVNIGRRGMLPEVRGVITGDQMGQVSDAALPQVVQRHTIFARVSPDQKRFSIPATPSAISAMASTTRRVCARRMSACRLTPP